MRDAVLLSYAKGDFDATELVRLASASKLLTGLAVWSLIERGEFTPASFLPEWSGTDARADVTLGQLMACLLPASTPPPT